MHPRSRLILNRCFEGILATYAPISRFEGTKLSAWRLLTYQASDRATIGLFALINTATLGYTLGILLASQAPGVLECCSQRQRL